MWDRLPAKVSSLVFKLVEEQVDLSGLRSVVHQAAEADQASLMALVDAETVKGRFFTRPEGRVLESLAPGPLLTALTESAAFARFSAAARDLDHLLDPQGALLDVLVALQARIDTTLRLDQIERIATETDFQKLDALFRRQLSEFLGKAFDFSDVVTVRRNDRAAGEEEERGLRQGEAGAAAQIHVRAGSRCTSAPAPIPP